MILPQGFKCKLTFHIQVQIKKNYSSQYFRNYLTCKFEHQYVSVWSYTMYVIRTRISGDDFPVPHPQCGPDGRVKCVVVSRRT